MQSLTKLIGRSGLLTSSQTRFFATEREILNRINATSNIAKITATMKMVSASKLQKDQSRLEKGGPYNDWTAPIMGEPQELAELKADDVPANSLFVPITSDRGLCGGVNSAICRPLKNIFSTLEDQGKDAKILVVGDKGRAQLRRLFGEHFTGVMSELSAPITWDLAACIAQVAIDQKASHVHVLYNNFKSAISYVPMVRSLSALSAEPTEGEEEAVLGNYEFEPNNKEEVFANMQEYMLASQIYYSLLENATSEQSSRMNAMENASKNAGEMIDSLTLQYNRARQARITTELVEIISGASAL
jgi:F-type H+-transporting ATPase subunit gamma